MSPNSRWALLSHSVLEGVEIIVLVSALPGSLVELYLMGRPYSVIKNVINFFAGAVRENSVVLHLKWSFVNGALNAPRVSSTSLLLLG